MRDLRWRAEATWHHGQSDTHHKFFRRLFSQPPQLLISALVVQEGYGWILRRYDPTSAMRLLTFLEALPDLQIVAFDEAALRLSSATVRRFADQKLTLADADGIAIMSERAIALCWSTDRHLSLGGARLVTSTVVN